MARPVAICTYFLNLEPTLRKPRHQERRATLEEWLTVAQQGGHTAKLRELLERLHLAISLFCLGVDAGLPAPKPPVDWFYRNLEGQVQIVTSSRASFLSEYTNFLLEHNGVSAAAHKLTKHEDPRVEKAAAALCDYWRTLASVIRKVPKPPPAPAPVSNLPPDFFTTEFTGDVLALVFQSMSSGRVRSRQGGDYKDGKLRLWFTGNVCSGKTPDTLLNHVRVRVRVIAGLRRVCKGFRDAAGLVLQHKDEAEAVARAKREAEAKRAATAEAKARFEQAKARAEQAKARAEWAIRQIQESAQRKPKPGALTEKNLRLALRRDEAKRRAELRDWG